MKLPAFAALLAAFLFTGPSFADRVHATLPFDPLRLNGKSAAAAPTIAPSDTKGILNALLKVKDAVIADVLTADAYASTTIAGSTPAVMWDPIAHMCFAGIGTPGEPGYVPGLVAFIHSVPDAPALPTAASGQGGLVTAAEHARLVVIAAEMAIEQISALGYPTSLRQACGSLINDMATQGGQIMGTAWSVNALLMKFIPALAFKP
jgi:hypothetical protein